MSTAQEAAVPRRPQRRVQSVDRTIDVLEALTAAGGAARSKEVAEAAGLPVPTVHRLLATLVARGYVLQLPDRSYCLGSRLVRLGAVAAQQSGSHVQPVLDRLVARLEETVNLAFCTQEAMTYVAQSASHRSMRMFTEVGRRVPLHSSGVGKAVLAALPNEEVTALLTADAGPRGAEAVLTEIRRARRTGYAVDDEEQEAGVRCLAVPVPGAPAPAALSVSAPSSRLVPEVYEAVAHQLRAAARELTAHWAETAE
ncbi:IclR family transcriptional regulator [Brevibacterium album]|uniref:IclR family transcriptional regulator n=1 Tax=Brevibacterium album TaxID=417948 RepID=UPI00041B3672|nr:IclR family transcriptional regulator [Brevibacterium album]